MCLGHFLGVGGMALSPAWSCDSGLGLLVVGHPLVAHERPCP